MKLAEIFQDGMIIQREKPFAVWGETDAEEEIAVRLNGRTLCTEKTGPGKFRITVPAQPAAESVTLEIGDLALRDVDFGEVWIAGGQSNMNFLVKWDAEREEIYAAPADRHVRYYEVGKYCFEGEEKDGFKDGSRWNTWFPFKRENSPYFSAVATWFALRLRETLGVPVGVVGCSVGGTSASTWMDDAILRADPDLKIYTDEYDASLKDLNLERYYKINHMVRAATGGKAGEEGEDFLEGNTGVTMQEYMAFQMRGKDPQALAEERQARTSIPMEEILRKGPNDPHPGSLYRTMVAKIAGFSCRGVLFYQGCDDVQKGAIYGKLFSALIACWRRDWGEELPFLFAQLAPFGSWMGNTGDLFPLVRRAQREVWDTVPKTYMVSTSDVGCEIDIHPKYKRNVGARMYLQAMDKVYGVSTVSDAPVCVRAEKEENCVVLTFANAAALSLRGGRINALEVLRGGVPTGPVSASAEGNRVILRGEGLSEEGSLEIRFAETGYYEVNLYNEAGIPAVPFTASAV